MFYLLLGDTVGAGAPVGASGITVTVVDIVSVATTGIVVGVAISTGNDAGITWVFGGIVRIGETLSGELLSLPLLLGFLLDRFLLCVLLGLFLRVFGRLLVGVVGQVAALSFT